MSVVDGLSCAASFAMIKLCAAISFWFNQRRLAAIGFLHV